MTAAPTQPAAFALRSAVDADAAFCRDLILATVGAYWTADPGQTLAESHARKFAAEWPDDLLPSSRIIESAGHRVGLLTVYPLPERVFIRYLLLGPAHQSRGLGSVILRAELAAAHPLPVELKVDKQNTRAHCFYERLNFHIAESADTYNLLRFETQPVRTDD